MNKKVSRDYGLGDHATPTGTPVATIIEGGPHCPNCNLMQVDVPVKSPMLKGGKGRGTYLGCPACTYAFPMVCVATGGA